MKSLIGLLTSSSLVFLFGLQTALAATGWEVSGGGQIVENDDGYKVSFGVYGLETVTGYEGSLEVNFHNVGDDFVDKTKFNGETVKKITFYPPDSGSCNAALNMVVYGSWDGIPGYSVIFRAGDFNAPGHWNPDANQFDTIRIQLFDYEVPSASVYSGHVYDTNADDFPAESKCVGKARTKLDRGNINIEME